MSPLPPKPDIPFLKSQQDRIRDLFQMNERFADTLNRILLVIMLISLAVSAGLILARFLSAWMNPLYLIFVGLLISLEVMFTRHYATRSMELGMPLLSFRVVEWIVILVTLKLTTAIANTLYGFERLLEETSHWTEDFLGNFFSGEFGIIAFVAIGIWSLAHLYLIDLKEIEGDTLLLDRDGSGGTVSNRGAVRQRMATRFLVVGAGVLIFAAILSVDYREFLSGQLSSHRSLSVYEQYGILIYFLTGMLILSQTQFAILRANWAWERIPIDASLAKPWLGYSLIALILLVVLAFLLPANYSIGLLSILSYFFSWIAMVLYSLFFYAALIVIGLISYILSFLKIPLSQLTAPVPPEVPDMPEQWVQNETLQISPLLQSILFWAIFLGIVVYAFYQYFHQNRDLLERLKQARLISFLAQAWRWISHQVKEVNREVTKVLQEGVKRFRSRSQRLIPSQKYVGLRRLSPQQRVLFYYYALIRRSEEAGISRRPSQTPYEFQRLLRSKLMEEEDRLDIMTDDFMEARYSQHPIHPERANRVRQAWDLVRRKLTAIQRERKGR